jgi:Arc/MetJ-type ribon-helix-helix transcriptional regulator
MCSFGAVVFDNASKRGNARSRERAHPPKDPEEARIALRCNRKELELLDSFVADGEFESRSELMRGALHAFLRARALSAAPTPRVDSEGLMEVPVRLRPDEVATWEAYAKTIANGRPVADLLAEAVRHYEHKHELVDLAKHGRERVRDAVDSRAKVHALGESGRDLERKGMVGR